MPPSWMNIISTVYPDFYDIGLHVKSMDIKQRSAIIKCCQSQKSPNDPSSTLYRLVSEAGSYRPPFVRQIHELHYFLQQFQSKVEGPVSSSIILDICRSAPLFDLEILQAQVDGWNKEIACCEEKGQPPRVNWEVIFDPSRRFESILPGVPPNPSMAMALNRSLHRWLASMNNRILYPRITHKNMSRDTRREYEDTFGLDHRLDDVPIFGQDDWMRVYLRHGIQIGGVCEMRQKWYPSGAKPRTYYAQGGTTYAVSSYLQDAFTELVNSSPMTHHIHRLRPTRLQIRQGQHLKIYDLSSFTSRMSEQKHFTSRLASFAGGSTVGIMDVSKGLLYQDLGDILHEYNEVCNWNPEVSYERAFKNSHGLHVADHGIASMLGIFGNLMTCTFAHGALVSQNVETEDQNNTAGDDGAIVEDEENEYGIDICICALGSYEPTKTFRSDEEGCICLKRPLWQEDLVIHTKNAIIPPTISLISYLLCDVNDPRYSFSQDSSNRHQSINIVGKDLLRFLRSAYRLNFALDDEQLSYVANVYDGYCRLANISPRSRLPQSGDPFLWPEPVVLEEFREEDPLIVLIARNYRSPVEIPVRDIVPRTSTLDNFDVGDVFECNSDRHLVLLTRLGLLSTRKVTRLTEDYDGYLKLVSAFVDVKVPFVCEYEVLSPIPAHLSCF
jgi:hypothetical protein